MNDRVIFLEPGQVKRGWERFSHQTEDDDYYNDAMGDFGPIGRELRARYRASCATGGCGARGGHAGTPYCPVSYTHLTLPTKSDECRSRWSPYH